MFINKYTVQMTISFVRTKNFKNTKLGFTFHTIIEESISDLKPDGNGPIKERIKNPKFVINNMGGNNLECILNIPISDFDGAMRELIVQLISKLKKNFQKWGKYKIQINGLSILQNIDDVKL